ncbi:VC0807 family protein [Caballeronia insecticola]|uniref:Putative transmembrane protein n=1 Tax=Caballeronia insecticola TaxID=758793 RepID=R4WSN5_9BURK|nr:VC0807 family protein [Caballeronia insecticola]BAN27643.1 putative transmembrane protein [Caballeronia insecticola]
MRYAFAILINVVLPWLAYRLALPHVGMEGAMLASAVPLGLWLGIDFIRFSHIDALSGIVLAGIVMSIAVLALQSATWLLKSREPLISGAIGFLFLLSLLLRRPLVFYLARSTLSRERQGRELDFDVMWRSQPKLMRSIRLMTAVWGIGLVVENLLRLAVLDWLSPDDAERASTFIRYGFYAALTIWTMLYRRMYLKKPDQAI